MINNTIAYIICESDIVANDARITNERINGKAVGEGILQTAEETNRNGRFYSKDELFPQLTAPRTIELLEAGYLRAEMGHPLSKDLQRQATIDDTKTCARFLKLWTEGFNIWGRFTATNNKYGAAFNADLLEGCSPAWSLRALGSVDKTARGLEVKNIRLITWDQVIYPSHPGAYTQRLVSEAMALNEAASVTDEDQGNDYMGESLVVPIANENVINFLRAQSSNLKFVRECFDFAYSGINVNKAGTKVLLTSNAGETLVVNIESYIHNELMNYASEYESLRRGE
jgi:hypothetical protein